MSRRRVILQSALSFSLMTFAPFPGSGAEQSSEIPYAVPPIPWAPGLGNHRVVLEVENPAEVVYASIPWRRRDADPGGKRIIVVDSVTGKSVDNIFRLSMGAETGEFLFGPLTSPGRYFVYYTPYTVQPKWGWYEGDYLPPETTASDLWVRAHSLRRGMDVGTRGDIVRASVESFQARTPFDSFYPMEVPATAGEVAQFLDEHRDPYFVFAEGREFPIRMRKNIPRRWMEEGAGNHFAGKAGRNEYYAFQIGVYAARLALDSVVLEFGPLRRGGGTGYLSASALTCFNTGGIDARGREFVQRVNVPQGCVQAFWVGIDVPRDAQPGTYSARVLIRPANAGPTPVDISLEILDTLLADRGDGEPWRHSRLRWLNSRAGLENSLIDPYIPVRVSGKAIDVLGRRLILGPGGLPARITSWGHELLARPVRFECETGSSASVRPGGSKMVGVGEGFAQWQARASSPGVATQCEGRMEFDGTVTYRIVVRALADQDIRDVRLVVPFKEEQAGMFMGMGKEGCATPETYRWKWAGPQDSYWMGSPFAGLHCEFRGSPYHGPMLNLYHPSPPQSWDNGGKGEFRIMREERAVLAVWSTGPRSLSRGDSISFEFAFLITPVKKIDPVSHFRDRYYHGSPPAPDSAAIRAGVKVINVHHASAVNPCINYPFIAVDTMAAFVRRWHDRGFKIKIYYTVRELTDYVTELWALRSLGTEVLAGGKGGGFPWLREHLESDYTWQWYQPFEDGTADAAILTSGESRWYNYYVEGLRWLTMNVGIDGLYLDDVTYDRTILQRMRRVMQEVKKGCLIDLHSNTGFSIGPANQYAEFFPYVDKLWFGESFRYDAMSPENWMVEVSGIPYGLMGDMLQGGGNPWRGMLYGMTTRLPWGTENIVCDPRNIWEVWDDFGIERSRMAGYWDPGCPVRTSNPLVLATAYVREGRVLVALASWDSRPVSVKLIFNWKLMGLDEASAVIDLLPVRELQQPASIPVSGEIAVEPLRGALLLVRDGRGR